MKISWGIKIIFAFAVFAIGIISMAVISMRTDIDLVSEKYYENEIKYQEHIELIKSSRAFIEGLKVLVNSENIILELPKEEYSVKTEGEINFYRSSDASKDFKIPLETDSVGAQKISRMNLDKGLWKVNVILYKDGKKYFAVKSIFLE